MKKLIIFNLLLLLLLLGACTGGKNVVKAKKPKFNYELLYKVWDVETIVAGGKSASGAEMGDPQYEFTRDGKRIKSYKIPPHSESVDYFIRNDSIHYKGEKSLPSSAIVELTDKKLVLRNDKAEWILYIK